MCHRAEPAAWIFQEVVPDPEGHEKAVRRKFTAEYRRRIL